MEDAIEMGRLLADLSGVQPEQILVLSTGIIGEHLPMDRVAMGIESAAGQLAANDEALVHCARGMMTTDTRHKLVRSELQLGGKTIRIVGIAKGAAMIGPKMATMLAVILTDAKLAPEDAQRILSSAVDDSFNCISVEGHMSTNDTVLMLANGAASEAPLSGADLTALGRAVSEACIQLAREIPNDGEGATHLIEVEVQGCRDREEAHRIARTVADSPLVKTAVAGADPNWGRIISAAGYAGIDFDPREIELAVNGFELYRDGTPLLFDAEQVAQSIRANRDTQIRLQLRRGTTSIRFWTCDLTTEYVRLNADYHT
jgi:glutamate N-acetyltransferase/amino-acid N-acetyltransferase